MQASGPLLKSPTVDAEGPAEIEKYRNAEALDPFEPLDKIVDARPSGCSLEETFYCYDQSLVASAKGGHQYVKIAVNREGMAIECRGPSDPENSSLLRQSCEAALRVKFRPCAELSYPCQEPREFSFDYSWFVPIPHADQALPRPKVMAVLQSKPPMNSNTDKCASLICSGDYPDLSLIFEEEGYVSFQVLVSKTGYPQQCWILNRSRFPRLDNATCTAILARARFDPARAANGEQIASIFTSGVTWRIPR
jgi:hypothetical protein